MDAQVQLDADNDHKKSPTTIQLMFQGTQHEINRGDGPLTVGRASDNDIQVSDPMVSRHKHGRCVFHKEGPVWVDWSANGAFVRSDGGQEVYIRQSALLLQGSSTISLAKRPEEGGKVIRYSLH
ncbi:MAG: FHA domain-containing protein [Magnetococcales bacterium]|nr:FHA domain-containing protein [Magnetococcales bacterium]